MPRYYFHTHDGRSHPDRDGLELPDFAAARCETIKALSQLVNEKPDEFWQDGMFQMNVADEHGRTLIILDLTATVSLA